MFASIINTPTKLFVFIGLAFGLLFAVAAAGTTYQIVYESQNKRYKRKEVIKSGIAAFIFVVLVTLGLVFILPRFMK